MKNRPRAPRAPVSATAAVLAAVLAAGGCAKKAPPKPPPEAVPVTVAAVAKREMPVEVHAIGHVEAASTVSVKPQVGGEIVRVHFKEGDVVKAGSVLFTIDTRTYDVAVKQAQANVERDRVRAANAKADSDRYAELVKKEFVTREQYDAALSNYQALEATVKAEEAALEQARLQLSYAEIRSPISGRTGSLLVHAGNLVKANDDKPLVVINQVRPVLVAFTVPELYLDRIRTRARNDALSVAVTPSEGGGARAEGPLTFIDNAVDRTTGTVTLKATFANEDDALWPGRFVDVTLRLTSEPDALVVPAPAVQTGQSGTYVFVVKDDLTVESRPVTVARTVGQDSVIAKGLAAGERVVTDGQLRLAPGAKVEIKG